MQSRSLSTRCPSRLGGPCRPLCRGCGSWAWDGDPCLGGTGPAGRHPWLPLRLHPWVGSLQSGGVSSEGAPFVDAVSAWVHSGPLTNQWQRRDPRPCSSDETGLPEPRGSLVLGLRCFFLLHLTLYLSPIFWCTGLLPPHVALGNPALFLCLGSSPELLSRGSRICSPAPSREGPWSTIPGAFLREAQSPSSLLPSTFNSRGSNELGQRAMLWALF